MLQLPHFDLDLLRRVGRKQVRALPDLFLMQPEDRRDVYAFAGHDLALLLILLLIVTVVTLPAQARCLQMPSLPPRQSYPIHFQEYCNSWCWQTVIE